MFYPFPSRGLVGVPKALYTCIPRIVSRNMGRFSLFKKFRKDDDDLNENEYVELNHDSEPRTDSKVIVRPFVLEDFTDIKPILNVLREGYTIALINIRP